MKERPILFSAPMVNSILNGTKTQTRRIAKGVGIAPGIGQVLKRSDDIKEWPEFCPYGKPGDRLWLRETWQGPILDDDEYEEYRRNGKESYLKPQYCVYRATDQLNAIDEDGNELNWRPSIHMPRWASRISLEITGIRVERLQDISEEDAIDEGLKAITKDGKLIKYGIPDRDGYPGADDFGWNWGDWDKSPVLAYKRLWQSINGKGSWDLNPFVWVIEFKRI